MLQVKCPIPSHSGLGIARKARSETSEFLENLAAKSRVVVVPNAPRNYYLETFLDSLKALPQIAARDNGMRVYGIKPKREDMFGQLPKSGLPLAAGNGIDPSFDLLLA